MTGRILLLVLFILLTDSLLYLVIARSISNGLLKKYLKRFHLGLIAAFALFSLFIVATTSDPGENHILYRHYFVWMDIFLLIYLSKFVMLVSSSPLSILRMFRHKIKTNRIRSSIYIIYKYCWITIGIFLTSLTFFVTADGLIRGTNEFTIKRIHLSFEDLPASFDGYTIAQFSDIHLGSWFHPERVRESLNLLQSLNPNIIVFTGDLINVNALETEGFEDSFRNLSALGGKFAVLGNHDMGDFMRIDREKNLGKHIEALSDFYNSQGFNLLRNSHVFIHKNNDSILIAGVDNWGEKPFKKFGDLSLALKDVENMPFTILLSHDPTHWRGEILEKSGVNLCLSGHTHGGQVAIKLGSILWSPIQYLSPEWKGLFEQDGRFLYVNPGLGYVGFSGRVGIPPEITLISLHKN